MRILMKPLMWILMMMWMKESWMCGLVRTRLQVSVFGAAFWCMVWCFFRGGRTGLCAVCGWDRLMTMRF